MAKTKSGTKTTTKTAKNTRTPAKTAKTAANAPSTASSKQNKPEVVITLTHDQIAQRAYDIWLQKGRPMGQDHQNWLDAESQLRTGGRSS